MRSHPSRLRALKTAVSRLSLLAAALLGGCIGGTGTDTENGIADKTGPFTGHNATAARVVDGDGRPLAGVLLALHTPDFRADSSAAQDLLLDTLKTLRTDSSGYARFNLVSPGKYVVEGSLGSEILFFDTLAVSDVKALTAYTFRRRAVSPIQGKVRLASGLQVVSGKVFIRGTGRLAVIDAQGGYNLGALPAEVRGMAVGLTYRAAVQEARVAEQKPDTGRFIPGVSDIIPVFSCREVTVDSAARLTPQPISALKDQAIAPSFAATDSVRLDSAKVAAISRSCDSLAGGTVIAVRTPDSSLGAQKKDSVTTNLIAVDQGVQRGAQSPDVMAGMLGTKQLVPLNGCVALPGTVNTTYDLRLNPSGSSSDLLVADVADKCLVRL